jgi:hypothetical protein
MPEELREPEPDDVPLSAVEPHIAVGTEEEDDEGA